MAKLVLKEIAPESLMPGHDYLLYRKYTAEEEGGDEWLFAIWKLDKSGWAAIDAQDRLPDWPTHIFESPDIRHVVDSE